MVQYIPRLNASLALSLALFVGACAKTDSNASADSALNRDIQLAGGDSAAQSALTDVAASSTAPTPTASAPTTSRPTTTTTRTTTRPTTTRPTTTTRQPTTSVTSSGNTVTRTTPGTATSARVGTIPAGAVLSLASNEKVCTNTFKVGQRFTASVTSPVSGSNGAVIPSGATANVEVTELKRSENANDEIKMGFRVVSVSFGGHTYPVSATTTEADVSRVKNQPKSKDVQKVAGGAAIGAIAGQILGKSTKATVIGGAIGAATGAVAAKTTSNYEGCVNSGGRITATLNSSTQVTI